jgi:NAD(P)-dependent dehydrogenase (short-subunit alcohol dehydrogenase family)
MDLELGGKRALVTGGSKGIGKAVARQLLREGARVVIASREAAPREAALRDLARDGEVHGVAVDTTDDAAVTAMVAAAQAALGGIDILVNSAARPAGHAPPPKLAETTAALFHDEMNTKVMGYLRCCREAAPHMIAQRWGRIINVSGLAARQAGSTIGSIRNVAVAAMTKNLAEELGPHGINVTCVHPGTTRTERTPATVAARAAAAGRSAEEIERAMAAGTLIGRMVDADEVASVVVFLASPRSVAITGDAIACGGGAKGAIHY